VLVYSHRVEALKEKEDTKMTTEMMEVLEALRREFVTYGDRCDEACERCPYAEQCEACEGWWGCPCWEEGMGDDL
jgi:hypothetical protein